MEKTYKKTAVFNKDHYRHFGIHKSTASLYGDNVKDIETLILGLSENQKVPSHDTSSQADYWGWFDENKQDFTMIYPKYFLLDMCFPSGIKGSEEAGQGKAYRLEILK